MTDFKETDFSIQNTSSKVASVFQNIGIIIIVIFVALCLNTGGMWRLTALMYSGLLIIGCSFIITGIIIQYLHNTAENTKRMNEYLLQKENKDNSIPMKKCPYCAESIKKEAKKCRYCGSEIK